jgi:hypothetical protein
MAPLEASTTYTFQGTFSSDPFSLTINLPETQSQVENLSNASVPTADFTATTIVPIVVMNLGYNLTGITYSGETLTISTDSVGDITSFSIIENYTGDYTQPGLPPNPNYPLSLTITPTSIAGTVADGKILNGNLSGAGTFTDSIAPDTSDAPEPSTLWLFAAGAAGLVWLAPPRSRRRA